MKQLAIAISLVLTSFAIVMMLLPLVFYVPALIDTFREVIEMAKKKSGGKRKGGGGC